MVKKIIGLFILLVAVLTVHNILSEKVFKKYIKYDDYKPYVDAIIVFSLGWLTVDSIANYVYRKVKERTDESTGQTAKAFVRIMGLGVLLASLTSIFKVNSSAAITLGSFLGLVVGMASQSVLKNAAAGVLIILTRILKPGEKVKVKGIEGIVKEVRLMHIVIEKDNIEYYIPSSVVLSDIIWKYRE